MTRFSLNSMHKPRKSFHKLNHRLNHRSSQRRAHRASYKSPSRSSRGLTQRYSRHSSLRRKTPKHHYPKTPLSQRPMSFVPRSINVRPESVLSLPGMTYGKLRERKERLNRSRNKANSQMHGLNATPVILDPYSYSAHNLHKKNSSQSWNEYIPNAQPVHVPNYSILSIAAAGTNLQEVAVSPQP